MFQITQAMLNTISNAQAKLFLNDSPAAVGNSVIPSTTMKLVANSGRLIATARLRYSDSGATKFDDFVIAPDELTASLVNAVGAGAKTMQTFLVTTKAGEAPKPSPSFNITSPMLESFANGNAELYVGDVKAIMGTPVYPDSVLKAIPIGANRFFKSATFRYTFQSQSVNEGFIFNEDKSVGTISGSNGLLAGATNRTFTIITEIINPPIPTPDVTGANNVYVVTNDNLTALNKERVFINSSGLQNTDLGSFILGLIWLPFEIDKSIISNSKPNILLGSVKTNIVANKVLTEKIAFDFGKIICPKPKDNSIDYVNTFCVLHLPHSPSINLDVEYVVGQEIGIIYYIDVYSGEATINITSTKVDGNVFITKQCSLGINIPYILNGGTKLFNSNIDVGGDNKTNHPTLEIMRSTSEIAENYFNSVIKDSGKLYNQVGYVEVDNINISTKALKTEKDMLINILKNGVIL